MAAAPPRGALIVIEGLDRTGKSTQSARLAARLRGTGAAVEQVRFPARSTAIGRLIDGYLSASASHETEENPENATAAAVRDDRVIHLLFAANRWEAAARIAALVAGGTTVVVDRYYYSGCVYSAAKGRAGMDLAWCRQPEVGLPRPDVCVFFDLAPEEAAKRGGFGEERYETREMQERVRGLYGEMRRKGTEEAEDMVVVDAGGSVEAVEEEVWEVVQGVRRRLAERAGELRRVGPW